MKIMKKILLLLLVAVTAASLASCLLPSGGNGGDGGEGDDIPSNAIYGSDVDTQVVTKRDSEIDLTAIVERIEGLCGKKPDLSPDEYAVGDHEIVIGETSRPLTAAAKAAMQKAISREDDDEEYLYIMIYSDGASVAVVWSDELAQEYALEYFMENYLIGAKLELTAGYTKLEKFDRLAKMREEEEIAREAKYAEIAAIFGDDVADALRNHMSIYDERFYLWLADLYDPGEYDEDGNPLGGGFYYSNSARDNEGFLIDLESTAQALTFLTSAGMMNGNYKQMIPEKMQKEMVAFALSCQSPEDGYFYHPQWGTDISTGRQSRDVGWATNNIIVRFGYKPYWNAPNGVKGMYGEPGTSMTARLGQYSRVTAVSHLVAAAVNVNKWPTQLRSLENWEKYLKDFESTITTKSYSIGHTVAEQGAQIAQRDIEAAENGEPTGYAELTLYYFDKWQEENQQRLIAKGLEPNGLWEEQISYNSLNGLMKISAIYVKHADYFNYAEEAFASAVEIIMLENPDVNGKSANGSVDVYNPWISVARIFSILEKSGDSTLVQTMRGQLRDQAAEMIRATTRKTVKFRKDDGSYGYTWDYSPAKSQSAPVAVPNTIEGDVNGGTIALTGVTSNMLSALGISGLSIYSPSDLIVFLDRISELSHVQKSPVFVEVENVPVDFEENATGFDDFPNRVSSEVTDGSVEIVDGGYNSDKAILLTTIPDKGDALVVKTVDGSKDKSCYTVEWDMRFDKVNTNAGTSMQISVGNMYMLTLGLKTDGSLTFGDSSTTSSGAITSSYPGLHDAFEWHHIKLVHYRPDGNPEITLLYVDGELAGTSTNYSGKQSGTPGTGFGNVRFYALWSMNYAVRFDNFHFTCDNSVYEGGPAEDEEPPEPFDGYIDFDEADFGDVDVRGVTAVPNPESGNSITVEEDPNDRYNQMLCLVAKPSTSAGNWVYFSAPDEESGDDVYVFETDIYIHDMGKSSNGVQLYINGESGTIYAIDLTFYKEADGVRLTIDEKVSDNSRNEVILRTGVSTDSCFNVRVVYDPETYEATITVITSDDEYTATNDAYYAETSKSWKYAKTGFYTLFGTDVVMYFDNVVTEK